MSAIKKTFSKKIQERMAEKADNQQETGGKWRNISYPHIYKNKLFNFLDREYPVKCNIKGDEFSDNIEYHKGASHMNSSQVMCINFFKKFFENDKNEEILLKLLKREGIVLSKDNTIKAAIFEYVKDREEGTNFDFYIKLNDGRNISFEIKYTEAGFGKTSCKYDENDSNNKYYVKWEKIYKELVGKSIYLQGYSPEEFYANYQINRNIVLADHKEDIVVFLTPRKNDSKGIEMGRAYIDELYNPNIVNMYWEDVVDELLNIIDEDDEEIWSYYMRFKEKYIEVLNDE